MENLLSLGKGQYLGKITNIRYAGGIIASAVAADPAESSNDALHYHENPIVSFILEGDSLERIDRRTSERSAGDLKFYRAGELHQVKIKRFPSRNINFELEDHFLRRYEISEGRLNSAIEKNPNAKHVVLRMYKESLTDDEFTEPSIELLLLGLLEESDKFDRRKKPQWMAALYELLNDCWSDQLSLRDLSAVLKVHPVNISKYFSQYSSVTLGEYIRQLRINRSLSLIKNSRLSLTEIASHCGFADQSHFTRTFKELTGFLPKDFKKF
jgi:AraC family transcriptional regulator